MRERNSVIRRPDFVGWAMLLSSVLFLVVSLGFNAETRHKVAQARAANSISSKTGAGEAATLTTGSDKSNVPTPPDLEKPIQTDLGSGLTTELNAWAAKQPARQQWGVVVRSLDDNSLSAGIHGSTSFHSASIFKLYLVYGLAQLVPFEKWHTTRIDSSHSYADCVQAMMAQSDNQCAVEIGNKLGWNKVSALLPPAGYKHTSLKADPTPTTAADTAQLLSDLYNRKGFDDATAAFILDSMTHSAFRKGLVAGCPDCQVANKTGDNGGYLHDAGIVTINGQHYVVAIFSQGGGQAQIANVSRLVRDYILNNR